VPEALRPEDEQPTPGSPPEGLFWSPPRKGSLTALQLLELGGGGGPERAPEDAVRDRFPSLGQLDDLLPPPPPDPFGAPAADGDEEGAGAGAAHAHDPRYRYPSIEVGDRPSPRSGKILPFELLSPRFFGKRLHLFCS